MVTNINHKKLLELEYLIPSVLSERTTCVYLFSDHISDRVKKQMALAGVARANHLWLLTRPQSSPSTLLLCLHGASQKQKEIANILKKD